MSINRVFKRRLTRAVFAVLLLSALLSALLFVGHGLDVSVSTHYELPGALPNEHPDAPVVMRAVTAKTTVAEMAGLVAEKPQLVEVQDPNGNMLIHHAVMKERLDLVAVLLDNGADPNARGMFGATPLMLAIRRGREDIVALLLGRGADPAIPNTTALLELAQRGDNAAIVELIERAIEYEERQ